MPQKVQKSCKPRKLLSETENRKINRRELLNEILQTFRKKEKISLCLEFIIAIVFQISRLKREIRNINYAR